MSYFTIEELLGTAAGDGGSVPLNLGHFRLDSDDLLKAWSIERSHAIECEILLDLTRKVLSRIQVAQMSLSSTDWQNTDELIQQIDLRLRSCPADRA